MQIEATERMTAPRKDALSTDHSSASALHAKRWLAYLPKAAVLFGLLLLIARTAPSWPPAGIALAWALLSGGCAVGFAYHAVVRKALRQLTLQEGGKLARLNGGRILSLVVSFVASALCMAGLMIEAPKWHPEVWGLIALSVFAYIGIYLLMNKFLSGEYAAPFRESRTVAWSSAIVALFLCAAYAVLVALQPAVTYTSAAEAFALAPQPFAESSSPLMVELGKYTALADGLVAYGTSKAAEVSSGGYLAWMIALHASAFFGIATLIGLCSLEWSELKKVFLPLSGGQAPVKRYAATAAALPLVLAVGFFAADATAARMTESNGYTAAEQFIRNQVGVAAAVIDGKYYDQVAVDNLVAQAKANSAALAQEAEATLTPLVNGYFDACVANVDGYLDWYYSLPADYERLGQMIIGSAESYAQEQFEARIAEGVDDAQLSSAFETFSERAAALESDLNRKLADYEVRNVPDWLIKKNEVLNSDFLASPLQPAHRIMDTSTRLGISGAAGVVTGIVVKRITQRALTKPFFSKIASRIASTLASRGVGAAAGGVVGSPAGPAGVVAGIAIGTAASVGVDYGLLKIDEAQNREGYRDEIVETIEESRAEMLDAVKIE
ncbi:MAG: hypothetical protein IJ131_08120 [Eggerthellaceae bacterium]|nr:hypothetical protein [Eggerthellaceae bacterium]